MLIIAGGRRSGKTHRLAEMLKTDNSSILAVPNSMMVRFIEKDYPHLKKRIVVMGRKRLLGYDGDVYVDNLDMWLWDYLGRQVTAATITGAAENLGVPAYLRVSEGL